MNKLIRNSLLICLPLLAVTACKVKSKKNDNTAAVVPPVTTPAAVVPTTPTVVTPGSANQTPNANQSTSTDPANQSTTPVAPVVPTPAVTPSKTDDCETVVLDFEKKPDGSTFAKGERIADQYKDLGVTITSHRRQPNGKMDEGITPILFDSAERPNAQQLADYHNFDCNSMLNPLGNCDGFDSDLTTEKNGKILIIAENLYDINTNDSVNWVTYPDDNASGGVIKLFFSKPTSVISFDLISLEANNATIELFNTVGTNEWNLVNTQALPSSDKNVVKTVSVDDHSFITKMKINFPASGAVDNIKLCIKK